MADIEITVDGGTSKRLLTAGKYCDKNILVTATGGGGGDPEPPDDGKTRLYITVPANSMPDRDPPRNQVPLYIQQSVANGVTIDWGDGSDPETLPGTGNVHTTHTYQQAGDFVISLDPAEGCTLGLGHGSSSYCVMGPTDNNGRVYCNMLRKAIIGEKGITSITNYSFYYCYSLVSVSIGENITFIGEYAFYYCYSLSSVVLPQKVSLIYESAFRFCYSLLVIIAPYSLEAIRNDAFYSCYGVKEFHFFSATPPTLYNKNTFYGIPSDCIIYVPVGSLEAYQTATNWSTYANQMQEEPA